MFLGDNTRPGLSGLAVAGFILAVVCAVALARFGEAGDSRSQTGATAGAAARAAVAGHDARRARPTRRATDARSTGAVAP